MSLPLPPSDQTAEILARRDRLLALLADAGRVVVAFSGGVDSAVVAQAARLSCGDRALAVTAVSPSLATGEREAAVALAARIGISHRLIETGEFANQDYLQNAPDRCYHCKTELYSRLESLGAELPFDTLVNGANLDDVGDYRPGMMAAGEHRVRSPLIEAGLTKADVRELARRWELPVWDKPASPCLSSRIAYGLQVTPERVSRVDQSEQILRDRLGVRELRVRHEAHDLARIELPLTELPRLLDAALRQEICDELHRLGFKYVTLDLEGFRSGSMNAALPVVQLATSKPPAPREPPA